MDESDEQITETMGPRGGTGPEGKVKKYKDTVQGDEELVWGWDSLKRRP